MAKHWIEQTPGASPARSAPYPAGRKVCEIQRVKFDKMLKQKVIKPGNTERPASIVFATKMTVSYKSTYTADD